MDGLTQNMHGLEQHANRLEWNVDGLQRHASRLKRNVKGLNWNFTYALLTLCFLFALHRSSVNSNISLLEKELVRVESTKDAAIDELRSLMLAEQASLRKELKSLVSTKEATYGQKKHL